MNTFGERLDYAIKKRNVTKGDMSKQIGYNRSMVSNWCKDRYDPKLTAIMCICSYLDISADWLVMGRGEMEAKNEKNLGHIKQGLG